MNPPPEKIALLYQSRARSQKQRQYRNQRPKIITKFLPPTMQKPNKYECSYPTRDPQPKSPIAATPGITTAREKVSTTRSQ